MGLSLSNSLLELKCDRWYLIGGDSGGSVGDDGDLNISFFTRTDFLRFAAAEIFSFHKHRKIENNKNGIRNREKSKIFSDASKNEQKMEIEIGADCSSNEAKRD